MNKEFEVEKWHNDIYILKMYYEVTSWSNRLFLSICVALISNIGSIDCKLDDGQVT